MFALFRFDASGASAANVIVECLPFCTLSRLSMGEITFFPPFRIQNSEEEFCFAFVRDLTCVIMVMRSDSMCSLIWNACRLYLVDGIIGMHTAFHRRRT